MSDAETVYTSVRDSCNDSEVVVYQNVHRIGSSDSLFYTTVDMGGTMKMGGMLDSGSMACSFKQKQHGVESLSAAQEWPKPYVQDDHR